MTWTMCTYASGILRREFGMQFGYTRQCVVTHGNASQHKSKAQERGIPSTRVPSTRVPSTRSVSPLHHLIGYRAASSAQLLARVDEVTFKAASATHRLACDARASASDVHTDLNPLQHDFVPLRRARARGHKHALFLLGEDATLHETAQPFGRAQ